MRSLVPQVHVEPEISVGVPVFNGARFLRVALESVLAQTYSDFEIVVCDNASTDATEAICREYAARDRRIRYYRNEVNLGAATNFCRVFELSAGRYFRWLSADDYIAPTALHDCRLALEAQPRAVLACGRAAFVGADGEALGPYLERQALEHDSPVDRFRAVTLQDPQCHAVYGLMRSEVLTRTRRLGAFAGSDNTLLAELALYGRFIEVDALLFFRRIHPDAYSSHMSAERIHAFYTPGAKRKAGAAAFARRHRYENARAILRAPLRPSEKVRLLGLVLRMAWWQRADIAAEFLAALRMPTAPERGQG
jgi:glycosyltransferase involved in cell wall biosynthesis